MITIGNAAFAGCTGLTNVSIGNSVTTIGNYAFLNCTGLTSLTIPNSVTTIGNSAFHNCTGLTSLAIPYSVATIGSYAFFCDNVETLYFNARNLETSNDWFMSAYGLPKKIKHLVIGDSVQVLPTYVFYKQDSLASVIIGNSVTAIEDRAFWNCTRLTSVTIPNSVTSVGSMAFNNCKSLRDVIIGNSVTIIGESAFSYCDSLESLTIGNSVTSIGANAFYNCTSLTSVTFPNSVTSIGTQAFYDCRSLTNVTIGNSVTNIGNYAFLGCWNLKKVNIPNSLAGISYATFSGCTSLTNIVIPNSITNIGTNAFDNCNNLRTVYDLSDLNITQGSDNDGRVAKNADRVVKINGNAITGEGSNSIYQISATYSAVTNDDEQEYHIPEEDIPDNFIYHVNSNAKTATEWKAKNIILTDGEDAFKAPENFIAEKVTYTRSYEQGNRSTICLPFKPATVNGSSTTNLKFYEFAGFDGITITFNEVDFEDLAANTPYMVEWPALKTAQDFVFGATDATIPATGDAESRTVEHGNGKFIGTMERTHMNSTNYYGYKNGYFVQSAGGQAEDAHAHVNPFRAYFQITPSGSQGFAMPTELSVRFNTAEDNVGIDSVEPQQSNIRYSNDVYDMMGRMVRKNAENLNGLRKGVYIWKGEKKIVF